MIGGEICDAICIKRTCRVKADIDHLAQLVKPIVPDPRPGGKPFDLCFLADTPPQFLPRLGHRNQMTGTGKGQRRLQSGGARADDQHGFGLLRGRNTLRMPPASPFFRRRGVLRAADFYVHLIGGHADIAADTFTDVIHPAFADFRGQKRVGNAGPRRAN